MRDVDLTIEPGEFAVLLGPSGCGKSTLLRTINRLVEPTSGTVLIDGADVRERDPDELRRGIGYVIQAVGLFPHYTVARQRRRRSAAARLGRARASTRASTSCSRWSGSIRHGIATAGRASSPAAKRSASASRARSRREPRVLLMDEPFAAVDAIVRASLQDEIARVHRELGTTIVFVTHDVDEALRLADRVVVMNAGSVVQTGAPDAILQHPAGRLRALAGRRRRARRGGSRWSGRWSSR